MVVLMFVIMGLVFILRRNRKCIRALQRSRFINHVSLVGFMIWFPLTMNQRNLMTGDFGMWKQFWVIWISVQHEFSRTWLFLACIQMRLYLKALDYVFIAKLASISSRNQGGWHQRQEVRVQWASCCHQKLRSGYETGSRSLRSCIQGLTNSDSKESCTR